MSPLQRRLLLLIVVIGAGVRFATLSSQGFWFDELLAIQVISRAPGEMLSRIAEAETNPPLYFALAAIWERAFGDGELALRSLSAIFGVATIPVVFGAASALGSRRAGLAAAALTAASPTLIWYSQEARPYAMVIFLAALSFMCFARVLGGGDRRWLWGWAASSTLALATHYFAAVPIAIEVAWLLWRAPQSRRHVVLASGVIAVAAAALAPLALEQAGLASWLEHVSLGDRLLQVPLHFAVGMSVPAEILLVVAVAATIAAVAYVAIRLRRPPPPAVAVPAAVALIGFAVVALPALVGLDYVTSRNLLVLWAPFAVGLGAVLVLSEAVRTGAVVTAALCVCGLGIAIWTALTPEAGRPDWEPLAAGLQASGKGRVIVSESPYIAPLAEYLDGGRAADLGERVTTDEVDVVTLRPVEDYSVGPCWWLGFCGGQDLVDPGPRSTHPPAEFERTGGGSTDLFSYERLRGERPATLPPAGFGGVLVQEGP